MKGFVIGALVALYLGGVLVSSIGHHAGRAETAEPASWGESIQAGMVWPVIVGLMVPFARLHDITRDWASRSRAPKYPEAL